MHLARQDRIADLLGPLKWTLTPLGTCLFCLIGWSICAPFSSSMTGMALCWWGIGLLLAAIQLERPWLQVMPFPPVTVLMLNLTLRWVLGGMLLLMNHSESQTLTEDAQVWMNHVAAALPLNAAMSTAIVLIGILWNRQLVRNHSPARSGPPAAGDLEKDGNVSRKQLLALASITGIVAIGYIYVGFFSGTLDRGASYLDWAGKLWKPDTLFSAVIKLRDLYFLILPWLLWEWRFNRFVILFFGIFTTISIILSLSLGGRGLILYPILLLVGGMWLAQAPVRPMRRTITALSALFIIVIILLPIARNQTEFQKSGVLNLQARWQAIKLSLPELTNSNSLAILGRDLYTWSDPYLFREPALSQPPAGSIRLQNLLHLWVPKLINPNKPELNDGHLIAKEIIGAPKSGMHEGRHIWFPGVSLSADLYWRYRWSGVILGSVVYALIFNGLARIWYRLADLKANIGSLLIAIYPATFLQSVPLRSVSETAWNLGYELPKYIIILSILGFYLRRYRAKKFPNALP